MIRGGGVPGRESTGTARYIHRRYRRLRAPLPEVRLPGSSFGKMSSWHFSCPAVRSCLNQIPYLMPLLSLWIFCHASHTAHHDFGVKSRKAVYEPRIRFAGGGRSGLSASLPTVSLVVYGSHSPGADLCCSLSSSTGPATSVLRDVWIPVCRHLIRVTCPITFFGFRWHPAFGQIRGIL